MRFYSVQIGTKSCKAKFHTNGKKFLDREIEVDFAVPKDKYKEKLSEKEDSVTNAAEELVAVASTNDLCYASQKICKFHISCLWLYVLLWICINLVNNTTKHDLIPWSTFVQ